MSGVNNQQEVLTEMSDIFHQASLCEFQREFKFEMEYKMWQQKYTRRFVAIDIQII